LINHRLATITEPVTTVASVISNNLKPDDPTTHKGSNTWNFPYPECTQHTGQTAIFRRYKGDEVGKHFHPRCPNKNPEQFLLLNGKVEFWFRDLHQGSRSLILDVEKSGPVIVLIPPYILHGLDVISNEVLFMEQQTEPWNPELTFSEAEFLLLHKTLT